MKRIIYLFCLVLLGVASCSEDVNPKDIPFEMQPKGLQQAIGEELLEKMKTELTSIHKQENEFWRNAPLGCYLPPERRNILNIQRNDSKQILIRNDLSKMEKIPRKVNEFFLSNRNLSKEETNELINSKSYKFNDFPFYSSISRSEILKKVSKNEEYLIEAKNAGQSDYISFYEKALEEWHKRLQVITVLHIDTLKEIHPQASIYIKDELNLSGFSPLTIKALKELIELRNLTAKKYFGVSYLHLYFKYTRFDDLEAKQKFEALNYILPSIITDQSFARWKGWSTYWGLEIFDEPIEIIP